MFPQALRATQHTCTHQRNLSPPSLDVIENNTLRTNLELGSLGCKSECLTWSCRNTTAAISVATAGCGGKPLESTSSEQNKPKFLQQSHIWFHNWCK